MRWGRRLFGVIAAVASAGMVVGGISLAAVTDDLYGDLWHPHGSLGLAIALTGVALLVVGSWIALAPPSVWLRPWHWLDRPAAMLPAGLGVALAGVILLTIVDEAGGFVVFHPYDFTGLELVGLGVLALARGGWRMRSSRVGDGLRGP